MKNLETRVKKLEAELLSRAGDAWPGMVELARQGLLLPLLRTDSFSPDMAAIVLTSMAMDHGSVLSLEDLRGLVSEAFLRDCYLSPENFYGAGNHKALKLAGVMKENGDLVAGYKWHDNGSYVVKSEPFKCPQVGDQRCSVGKPDCRCQDDHWQAWGANVGQDLKELENEKP